MSFRKVETNIEGCYEVHFNQMKDIRGSFVKSFHNEMFEKSGITMDVAEEYFTYSQKNVFRGMHFQLPPKAIDKIVFCVSGRVVDYVVDIRKSSPTFGKWIKFELDSNEPKAVFVGKGLAHGFFVVSEQAIIQYKVSEVFAPKLDAGISFTSFDFANEISNPILSERDKLFQTLEQFDNPF